MREDLLVAVTEDEIDPARAMGFVGDPRAGGTCVFVGTVRASSDAGEVTGLTYEAWPDLAVKRLKELGDELFEKWPVSRVAVLHRFGDLNVGDVSVAIAVSAPHRAEAFDACRHAIERLKQDVPIWKKEHLLSGDSNWVMGS